VADESEIVSAFSVLKERRIGGLIIGGDTFFLGQMRWMAALAAHNGVPAIGPLPEFAAAGGLMTYGPSIADATRVFMSARSSRARAQPICQWCSRPSSI
jgi:putative ABC transport system substrate-binding protein